MLIELVLRRFGVGYTKFSLSPSLDPSPLSLCLFVSLRHSRNSHRWGRVREKERERERIRESINDAWKAESTLFSSPLSRLHYFSIRTSFRKTITWSNLNPNHISTTTTSTAKQKKGWVGRVLVTIMSDIKYQISIKKAFPPPSPQKNWKEIDPI